jgi:hypothetical protein
MNSRIHNISPCVSYGARLCLTETMTQTEIFAYLVEHRMLFMVPVNFFIQMCRRMSQTSYLLSVVDTTVGDDVGSFLLRHI